ncbi:hypothetical protein LCGC14_0677480 [marine sediment metagenome]|uniref:DUF2695 domain-containing protein n=1 Tax=marine sediment metagenome TaxID=412755 RepID=A0A0F9TX62_9ZZZZ|nr:MAG: hypothetical protein Lokiarch_41650 [Candidatus Lokiarchaeum sp. GC14_75]HEC40858.1 DUF2695 domain-containing protein [bacterium]
MKNSKIIRIKSDKLRMVRNNLRAIIILAVEDEMRRLTCLQFKALNDVKIGKLDKNTSDEIIKRIINNISDLKYALKSSICLCSSCSSKTKDMGFNPIRSSWFCIDCLERSLYTPPDLYKILSKDQLDEFFERLNDQEGINFDGLNWECHSDYRCSKRILTDMGIDSAIQQRFFKFCDIFGGECDCEILMNIAELTTYL